MKTLRITLPDPIEAEIRKQASSQGITVESYVGNWLIETWLNRATDQPVKPTFTKPKSVIEVPRVLKHRKSEPRGPVHIRLRFDLLGDSTAEEFTCNNMADALVKVVTALYSNLGVHVLEQLSVKKYTRGKITSQNPEVDFRNGLTGKIYGNRWITGSDYYARTHSSSDEKLDQFKEIERQLGLPMGFIAVNS